MLNIKIHFAAITFFAFFFSTVSAQPQIEWLKSQQDLNGSGLVDSYENDGTNRAYLYDQALAVIAFSREGEQLRAKMLLERVAQLQSSEGGWYECYDAADPNILPAGRIYNTGQISWMVIATNYYQARTGDANYAEVADTALEYLGTVMVTNPSEESYGAIRYCSGPDCPIPNAISTEHNHDAYSAFYWRGIIDGNESYLAVAELIRGYLSREMWGESPESDCPYNSRVFWRGFEDCAWCTDTQSWGVLSLGSLGPANEPFYESLNWLWYSPLGNTRTSQDFNGTVLNVDGFKSCTDEPYDYVWVEATDGVAAAYYAVCDWEKGDYFHGQTSRVISSNGALPHSFSGSDPDTIRWPDNWRLNSVAATCWYYFNERKLNPFNLASANSFFAADIEQNGLVDLFDYSIMANEWGQGGIGLRGDCTSDCQVDLQDLALMAEKWLDKLEDLTAE